MAESMRVDSGGASSKNQRYSVGHNMHTDTCCFVYNKGVGIKRLGQEDIFERKKRGRGEKMCFARQEILTPWEMLSCPDLVVNPPKIARFLEFTVALKEKEIVELVNKIKNGVNLKQLEEIEKHTKDLAERVSTDPRMIRSLPFFFLSHLLNFLEYTENPNIQSQAIIILQTYIDCTAQPRIIKKIKASTLVRLICSEDCEVKVQAMCLLRTMALSSVDTSKLLEAALEPLTLLITGDTVDNYMVLNAVGKTMAVICQVYPMLPSAKLEIVISSLLKLLKYKSSETPPHACLGLLYLCDGRKEMVVAEKDFEFLINCLLWKISLYNSVYSRVGAIAALSALGTIVRWGNDDHIEAIMFYGLLELLPNLLHEEGRDVVQNACWIISNITAGKVEHVLAIIKTGLIDHLFHVVLHHKLLDVKKEAAWAISNAIHGIHPPFMWSERSWFESFWTTLKVLHADQQIVAFCLEGLVYLGGVEVTCNGKPIDAAEFKKLLARLRWAQFQPAVDAKVLPRSKKPRYADNIKRSDDDMDIIFHVTCTFKEDMQQSDSQIYVVYRSLEEDDSYVLGDSSNIAADMEVVEPEGFW